MLPLLRQQVAAALYDQFERPALCSAARMAEDDLFTSVAARWGAPAIGISVRPTERVGSRKHRIRLSILMEARVMEPTMVTTISGTRPGRRCPGCSGRAACLAL
ncbi:hypothetical protein CNECB9_400006 [Cupriavidus necator]|uniref:Uncharacterized protein n=1 Tax=Cupriavidus necator TaxID=106590 RepID=A0A1K0JRL9_CUPNE|nr:hypothetical protein CNECB9_400006 [Cupriavidus necator]